MSRPPASKANTRIALLCAGVFVAMVGAGFAAVPLYRVFCQVTGFDGTVGRAVAAPGEVLERTVKVRFDTNVRDLPWTFKPQQTYQIAHLGETKIAHFTVVNNSDAPITGQATFNVTPEVVGAHFKKVQCFCFEEQTLDPGETMDFPVVYFVDPEFATDFETRGKQEVTLSYTFFRSKDGEIESAALGNHAEALGETRR